MMQTKWLFIAVSICLLICSSILSANAEIQVITDSDTGASWRLEQYITTHWKATGGDGQPGGERESGRFEPYLGKDADLRRMNYDKDGHPFLDRIKSSYNNYHSQTTAYNAVKIIYDATGKPTNDENRNGIADEIEVFQMKIFRTTKAGGKTGFHCDILNYSPNVPIDKYLLENNPNIQIINNIIYGTSLFTITFPPGWKKSGSYAVLLHGLGAGADNNSMYKEGGIEDAVRAALSVENGGLIVVSSNCGGEDAMGVNSNSIEDVRGFLTKVMSRLGADVNRVVTVGGSRAGLTSLTWGATDPADNSYNAQAVYAGAPLMKIGSTARLSLATFPSWFLTTDKILGSRNAHSYYYEDKDENPPRILTPDEKGIAALRIMLGADDFVKADEKSPHGIYSRPDLIDALKQKRIFIRIGTHDAFIPLPYFLGFDRLLEEQGIPHTATIGYGGFGHGFHDDVAEKDCDETLAKLERGEEMVPYDGGRIFYMPDRLENNGKGTEIIGLARITNDIITEINNTKGHEDYFGPDHDAAKLGFSASVPYAVGKNLPVTVTLIGEEGKSWELWVRKEDGYKYVYHKWGIFGESINHPYELECGREYEILNFNANVEPGRYEWFFKYDGKEIPNRFTPFVSRDGIYRKAVSVVLENEPSELDEYFAPDKATCRVNFGIDQYHPLLRQENNAPVIKSISDILVSAGQAISFRIQAADPDNDELVYDIRTKDGQMLNGHSIQFNGLSGEFSYVTSASDVGVYLMKAIVKDGKGGVAEQQFKIEVK